MVLLTITLQYLHNNSEKVLVKVFKSYKTYKQVYLITQTVNSILLCKLKAYLLCKIYLIIDRAVLWCHLAQMKMLNNLKSCKLLDKHYLSDMFHFIKTENRPYIIKPTPLEFQVWNFGSKPTGNAPVYLRAGCHQNREIG